MDELKEESLSKIAERYGISVDTLIEEMCKLDYRVLSRDFPVTGQKLADAHMIAKRLSPNQVQPKPQPKQQLKQHPKPVQQSVKLPPLGKDLVVITQSALRNKTLVKTIDIFRQVRSNNHLNNQIVIQGKGLDALRKLLPEDPELEENLKALEDLKEKGMLFSVGGEIYEEDRMLWKYILSRCQCGKSIVVVGRNTSLHHKITQENNLHRYSLIYEREIKSNDGHLRNPDDTERFFYPAEGKQIAPYSEAPISLQGALPDRTGQTVYDMDGLPIKLGKSIGGGSEGAVFLINAPQKCVKILKPDSLTELKLKKIDLMIRAYPNMHEQDPYIMDRIAWPEQFVYNEYREMVGYIMRFFPNAVLFSEFSYDTFPHLIPNITKMDQVKMAKNLAEIIDFVHSNHIILCDMNRRNVMFNCRTQQAYLVDLDSVQVADEHYYYPPRVGTQQFLAPEHAEPIDVHNNEPVFAYDFFHTQADDVWALQMMLFLLITPAQDPYSLDKPPREEWRVTKEGMFPFQCAGHGANNLRLGNGGPLHIMYSHLPSYIKTSFWDAFHAEGAHFTADKRRSAFNWVSLMVRYENDLPKMIENNPESGLYWPKKRNLGNPDMASQDNSESSDVSQPSGSNAVQSDNSSSDQPNRGYASWDTALERL